LKRPTFWLTLLIVAALVTAAFAWRRWIPRTAALDPGWTATATVLAGDGVDGVRDGDASRARFSDPFGVAVSTTGTIYVADAGDANRIRGVSPDGTVATVAGGVAGFEDGRGASARFRGPSGLAIDAAGNLYIADTGNNAIRRITPDGIVATVAGDGVAGFRDGPGRDARFNGPIGLALDAAGRVIVADTYNDRIRLIATDGTVSTLAGAGTPGARDGDGRYALFDTPSGVAADGAGTIYVADTGNGAIRTIDANGTVTTPLWAFPDGLIRPVGVAAGAASEVYVTDDRGRILAVAAGTVRVLAGSTPGFSDGLADAARFRQPAGIAVAGLGRLIVADAGNRLVRAVAASSRADLRPPAPGRLVPTFDAERFGFAPLLWPVAPMEGTHEVAGTLGEARGTEGAERFHAGIDVRKEEGTPVLAVRDGIVSSPIASGDFGALGEWMRIGPVAYVHIRAGRERPGRDGDARVLDDDRFVPTYDEFGALVRMRVKRGARFASGEAIGTINAFNHVHLNVGWTGEEYNPLAFRLLQFTDTIPPTIARGGVRLLDELGQRVSRRVRGRVVVSGRIRIVVDAWDRANGNRPERRLGLYELGYQVLNRNGTPTPGFEAVLETLRFDRMSADPNAARLVYAPGSGIPFYRGRRTRFLYLVTNTFQHGVASPGSWDTSTLPPGDYVVRAWARDASGNEAIANRDLPVTIAGR
jgi:sugar lactone lactonase YvrE